VSDRGCGLGPAPRGRACGPSRSRRELLTQPYVGWAVARESRNSHRLRVHLSAQSEGVAVATPCGRAVGSGEWGVGSGFSLRGVSNKSRCAATHLPADLRAPRSSAPVKAIISDPTRLRALLLFSGPTGNKSTLGGHLRKSGWVEASEIDNDAETGGGWSHDLMNDAVFTSIMADAHAGKFDALVVAHPCSTFSVSRFFDASKSGNKDPGPPPVRTAEHPDGLPDDLIDPRHQKELKNSTKLLDRMVQVCIAAHSSTKKTTIVLENPSDRSIKGSNAYQDDVSNHGSLWATSQFKALKESIPLSSMCTFAQCMFNRGVTQKYTTLWYTNDAARLLDQLNKPASNATILRTQNGPEGEGQTGNGCPRSPRPTLRR